MTRPAWLSLGRGARRSGLRLRATRSRNPRGTCPWTGSRRILV